MLRNLEIVPSTESWSELLEWVNRSMPVEAPNHNKTPAMRKVEDCGHGVPYVLMLPMMLPIIHTPLLTSRVKVPAKTDFEAVANLKIMQDALRRNGIVIPDVLTHDSQKLIGRNFQANLQLLQWFRGLSVALQQCGIEAGEGRIVLAAPMGDSVSSLDSPPASVVRAEERRRAESMSYSRHDRGVVAEAHAADARGDAAAAAAVAILSESRARSRDQSHAETSPFKTVLSQPRHSPPHPSRPQQQSTTTTTAPQRKEDDVAAAVAARRRSDESPSPVPPPMEPSAAPPAKQTAQPAAAAAAAPSRRVVEPAVNSTQPAEAKALASASATPAATPAEEAKAAPAASSTSAPANMHHRPPASRRASTAAGVAANGSRTPKAASTHPSTAGSSSVIFKAVPARLSAGATAARRAPPKSGKTPRAAEKLPPTTRQSALRGRRNGAATPGRDAEKERAAAAPATEPVNATAATQPPQTTQAETKAPTAAAAPQSASPAQLPASPTSAVVAAPPDGVDTEVDVLQLQIDRQFYYDKLRAIEELVDCMEAKKSQERTANAAAWSDKDDEMMDFTNSVRSVLYAES